MAKTILTPYVGFKDKGSQIFNVMAYGAVGNGTTDDTTAIQSAITAALATGNKSAIVYFPAGSYKITTSLNCTSATGSASGYGVLLRGAGHNASQIVKGASIAAVTFNGNGGPSGNNTAFGGMRDITVNGNGFTGAAVQTNSAQQMLFRGCSFINNADVTWDFNTMQDSYFLQCTFNNCGSTTQPVVSIYGSSSGTANMLWFEQIRIETFLKGAVWIKRGTGATGGGNNGFFFSQCKFETITVNGDIFYCDGYVQQLVMDQIFLNAGGFNTGYSTAANGIVFGDGTNASGTNQATFTNILMNVGSSAGNSVININGDSGSMNGPIVIRNIVQSGSALATGGIVVTGGSGFNFEIDQINVNGTTLSSSDSSYYNSASSKWTILNSGVAIQGNLPASTAAPALGGYYNGLGIGGTTNNVGNPIFGVLTSTQSGNGTGHTAFTVLDTNKVYTYNNTLDDGSGNMVLGGILKKRVNTLTVSSNTYTPNIGTTDIALITSPTAAFTVAAPTGTASDGQQLLIRIKSGTTGYAPTWNSAFSSSGIATLPTSALPASKTVTLGFQYDASATKWILLALDGTGY